MQLKNKVEREKFLNSYREWELWKEIPELELKFYRYRFSNGTMIIATEFACMKFNRFGPKGAEYKKSTSVKYHLLLHKSDEYKIQFSENEYKAYNPVGDSVTAIIEYLTKTKSEVVDL